MELDKHTDRLTVGCRVVAIWSQTTMTLCTPPASRRESSVEDSDFARQSAEGLLAGCAARGYGRTGSREWQLRRQCFRWLNGSATVHGTTLCCYLPATPSQHSRSAVSCCRHNSSSSLTAVTRHTTSEATSQLLCSEKSLRDLADRSAGAAHVPLAPPPRRSRAWGVLPTGSDSHAIRR